MKKTLFAILIFLSFKSTAQIDSATATITVLLPVKGIVLYSNNLSQTFDWAYRKLPDQILPLIGSGNQPDSVVTVSLTAGRLLNFVNWLMSERYGAVNAVARSIMNNSPSIPGYTALVTQVSTLAAGNGSQKAAATYVLNQYTIYTNTLTNLYNSYYANGLNWIKN